MEWIGQVVTGLGSAVAGFAGAFFLFRGKKAELQSEETKVEATATDAFLKGQQAFSEFLERTVTERVAAAVATLQSEVTELQGEVAAMRKESHEMNDAIRARETQLWLWNIRNRPGPMPALPAPILARLGISHLSSDAVDEDTQPII
jgi:phage shock protein A